jgi:hypothetical protein
MLDFTLQTFQKLLDTLCGTGHAFQTVSQYLKNPAPLAVMIRHDVDRKPENALKMAELEHRLNIPASYYFRIVKESFHSAIIKQISAWNHEIGYHYEDLTLCRGDTKNAILSFKKNLETFRDLVPIETICMHGSPLSPWDNRLLWEHYHYHDFSIIGEPYFDLDFDKILYLTDTGRRWNGQDASIRDKISQSQQKLIKNTGQLIEFISTSPPATLMLNIHPERWEDNYLPWLQQLIWQNLKNIIKRTIVFIRK